MLNNLDQKVDGQLYRQIGVNKYTRGSGDSVEETTFQLLVDDGARPYWLLEDKKQFWLYSELGAEGLKVDKEYETFEATTLSGLNVVTKLSWVGFKDGLAENLVNGLVVASGSGRVQMIGTSLWRDADGSFYRPTYPASSLVQVGFSKTSGGSWGSGMAPVVLGICLGLFFAVLSMFAPYAAIVLPIYWLIGPLSALFSSAVRPAVRFFAGLFFVHLGLHVLDANAPIPYVPGFKVSLEAASLAICSFGLAAVYRFAPRSYAALVDGFIKAGGWSWVISIFLIGCYSMADEYWHFSHFRSYLGEPVWGSIILLVCLGGWSSSQKDYAKVPLGLKKFQKNLKSLANDLLDEELSRSKLESIVALADDLEDTFSVTQNTRILAFAGSAPDFKRLVSELKVLLVMDRKSLSAAQLHQDLKTISSDVLSFRDATCAPDSERFYGIRPSPFLETWKQENL